MRLRFIFTQHLDCQPGRSSAQQREGQGQEQPEQKTMESGENAQHASKFLGFHHKLGQRKASGQRQYSRQQGQPGKRPPAPTRRSQTQQQPGAPEDQPARQANKPEIRASERVQVRCRQRDHPQDTHQQANHHFLFASREARLAGNSGRRRGWSARRRRRYLRSRTHLDSRRWRWERLWVGGHCGRLHHRRRSSLRACRWLGRHRDAAGWRPRLRLGW